MNNIILDMSEVDKEFIQELKDSLHREIRTSIECAVKYNEHESNHLKNAKLKQFALKIVEQYTH